MQTEIDARRNILAKPQATSIANNYKTLTKKKKTTLHITNKGYVCVQLSAQMHKCGTLKLNL